MEPRLTRDEKKAATRHQLLDAAQEVFSRRGYHAASVDDVAAVAGYTKGAVYSHFDSKEEMFLALVDDRIREQYESLQEASRIEDPERRAARWRAQAQEQLGRSDDWELLGLEFLLYVVRERPDLRRQLAARYRRTDALMADLFSQHFQHQGIQPPGPSELLALVQTALGEGLLLRRLVDPETVTPELFNEVFQLLFTDP